ncbi:MAG: hypothetical protein AB7P56_01555 [Nitrososphaeraceae archaeon]
MSFPRIEYINIHDIEKNGILCNSIDSFLIQDLLNKLVVVVI